MKPYIPDNLPIHELDYRRLFSLVADASGELARYDGLLQGVPNPAVMLSPLTTREAVLSSKIEGTQATVDEVLEQEAGMTKEGEKYKDIQEISNYRSALYQARDYLQDYPIRLGFIRQLHKILMTSVRGENKEPGEFRRIFIVPTLRCGNVVVDAPASRNARALQTEFPRWSVGTIKSWRFAT